MQSPASSASDYLRAADALIEGRSSVRVLAAMSPQQPTRLVAAVLHAARRRGVHVTLLVSDLTGRWAFLDESSMEEVRAGRLRLVAIAGAIPRAISAEIDYLPQSLWQIDRLIASQEVIVDVFLVRVTATDTGASFGEMVGFSPTVLDTDARVGFELVHDRSAPVAPEVRLDRADAIVAGEWEPRSANNPRSSAAADRIGASTAALIPDGATLQLGLGTVPLAVLPQLTDRRDLGLHSGILPDAALPLVDAGVITGMRKTRDRGLHVATGVWGDRHGGWGQNASLRPLRFTHAPERLSAMDGLWALNSGFEVDLRGQVNAEFVDGVRIASGGGQTDFIRAANGSRSGGASVIMLPSQSRAGRPRIVDRLEAEHIATTSGNDVDYLITEYGVASLRGLSAHERAVRIASVAHPSDRARLQRSLTRTNWVESC